MPETFTIPDDALFWGWCHQFLACVSWTLTSGYFSFSTAF